MHPMHKKIILTTPTKEIFQAEVITIFDPTPPPTTRISEGTGMTASAMGVDAEGTSYTTAQTQEGTGTKLRSVKGQLKANLCFWKNNLHASNFVLNV